MGSASKGGSDNQNQRRFERYRGRIPCRMSFGDSHQRGFVTDLSASGLFLETHTPLSPDTKLVLSLDHGDDTFVVTGRVARERRSHRGVQSVVTAGFAVELESAPETYFQIVADLDRGR